MSYALAFASVAAVLAYWGAPFAFGWTEPRLICMLLGVVAAWQWRTRRPANLTLCTAVAIYAVSFLLSLAVSRSLPLSLVGYPGVFSGGLLTGVLCAAGLILASKVDDDAHAGMITKAIMCAGVVSSVHALLQVAGVDPMRIGIPLGRATAMLGSHVDLGALLVVLLCYSRNPIFIAGILATHSRGAMLAIPVALAPARYRVPAFVLCAAIGLLGVWRSSDLRDSGRVDMWRVATESCSVLGSGPATFYATYEHDKAKGEWRRQAFAHNSVLEAYSTRGLLGLICLAAFLVAPQLAGLWTVCMFNPVSFEVVFVACVLVGLSRRHDWSAANLGDST